MIFLDDKIDRKTIKIKGRTTINLEVYLADLFAMKHFGKMYKEAQKETNDLIRSMAQAEEIGNTAHVRQMLIGDLVSKTLLASYNRKKKGAA